MDASPSRSLANTSIYIYICLAYKQPFQHVHKSLRNIWTFAFILFPCLSDRLPGLVSREGIPQLVASKLNIARLLRPRIIPP